MLDPAWDYSTPPPSWIIKPRLTTTTPVQWEREKYSAHLTSKKVATLNELDDEHSTCFIFSLLRYHGDIFIPFFSLMGPTQGLSGFHMVISCFSHFFTTTSHLFFLHRPCLPFVLFLCPCFRRFIFYYNQCICKIRQYHKYHILYVTSPPPLPGLYTPQVRICVKIPNIPTKNKICFASNMTFTR